MTSRQDQLVSTLFHAACQLSIEERAAFLAQACAGDEELRGEVEKLLAGDEQAGNFLNQPVSAIAAELLARSPASLTAGHRLGRYQIRSCLGAGGMGEVYLAEDGQLDRLVAIKLLPAEFTANAERVHRFIREAKAASALNHPNIITIHEIGEEDGRHFIVTEYIDGQTLRQRMAAEKLRLADALEVAVQVACALAVAHEAGIVHRDIKPENLMLRPDGYVKVLDFGLAKLGERNSPERATKPETAEIAGGNAAARNTRAGSVLGTAHYMSPEQALGLEVNARSDIFGLGVVLYEMIAGRTPFDGADTIEVMRSILDQEPQPLRPELPGIEPAVAVELERIVTRALRKNRDERYQTTHEMLMDLRKLKGELAALAEVPGPRAKAKTNQPRVILLLAVILFVGAVMIGAAIYLASDRSRTRSPALWNVVPFSGLPGREDHPSFSPDGNQLTFAWDGGEGGNLDIYVKQIGVGSPLRLTHHPAEDAFPVWSPDGRYIAFVRTETVNKELLIVPVRGGPERILCTVDPDMSYISWSPDASRVALAPPAGDRYAGRIVVVSIETGEEQPVTTPPPDSSDMQPAFSPDGRHLAFVRISNRTIYELYLTPVNGGPDQKLSADQGPIEGLAWTADSREIVYSSLRSGGKTLSHLPVSGGKPEPLYGVGRNAYSPAISRQNQRLAFIEKYNDTNIWRLELQDSAGRQGEGRGGFWAKLINSKREDDSPQFSPDGRKIAFISDRSGSSELWVCDSDGRNPLQLTRIGSQGAGTPRWSPDGRSLVFDARPDGNGDLFVISVEGGSVRRLTTDPSHDVIPSWSRDGAWIYFCSNRSGGFQIWRLPAAGGQPLQITRDGGLEAFEAPDERSVYYSKWRGVDGLWTVPATGGEEKPVPELAQAGYWRSWAVADDGIYFVAHTGSPPYPLNFFSFKTRRITRLSLVEKDPPRYVPGLTVSPDGRWLLYAQLDQHVSNIMLVENFR